MKIQRKETPTMKIKIMLICLLSAVWMAAPALAEDAESDRIAKRGDRIDARLDRKGDRIDQRLNNREDCTEARLDAKGDRISDR
jgi:hypothetical protein